MNKEAAEFQKYLGMHSKAEKIAKQDFDLLNIIKKLRLHKK